MMSFASSATRTQEPHQGVSLLAFTYGLACNVPHIKVISQASAFVAHPFLWLIPFVAHPFLWLIPFCGSSLVPFLCTIRRPRTKNDKNNPPDRHCERTALKCVDRGSEAWQIHVPRPSFQLMKLLNKAFQKLLNTKLAGVVVQD